MLQNIELVLFMVDFYEKNLFDYDLARQTK